MLGDVVDAILDDVPWEVDAMIDAEVEAILDDVPWEVDAMIDAEVEAILNDVPWEVNAMIDAVPWEVEAVLDDVPWKVDAITVAVWVEQKRSLCTAYHNRYQYNIYLFFLLPNVEPPSSIHYLPSWGLVCGY